ncbi:hypothetical protein RGQ15_10350 [Paracoccus sp. MBLB3053]|uniref:Bacteriophage tail tape measure C-terminal domain-containing protein n=1 Tax=Paracoccus aurantius TaxID=3073814 RepID=A0ABU2HSD8_9RHOB|nr:hypothetical protein [Paracoccus sp. MBLB3053]MDS9467965.1 hypothetical protein [Paracoccus sp. MBLB3053]
MADTNVKQTIQVAVIGDQSLKDYQKLVAQTSQATANANRALQTQAKAIKDTGDAAKGGSVNVANFSYQIQDMAVQMQMGTSALVIFAQQVPQMLVGMGNMVTVFVTVAAVAATAWTVLAKSKDPMKQAADNSQKLADSMDRMKDALDKAQLPLGELGPKSIAAAQGLQKLYIVSASFERLKLEKTLAASSKAISDMSSGLQKEAANLQNAQTLAAGYAKQIKAGGDNASIAERHYKLLNKQIADAEKRYGATADQIIAAGKAVDAYQSAVASGAGTDVIGDLGVKAVAALKPLDLISDELITQLQTTTDTAAQRALIDQYLKDADAVLKNITNETDKQDESTANIAKNLDDARSALDGLQQSARSTQIDLTKMEASVGALASGASEGAADLAGEIAGINAYYDDLRNTVIPGPDAVQVLADIESFRQEDIAAATRQNQLEQQRNTILKSRQKIQDDEKKRQQDIVRLQQDYQAGISATTTAMEGLFRETDSFVNAVNALQSQGLLDDQQIANAQIALDRFYQEFWRDVSAMDDLIAIMGDSFTQTFDGLVDGTIDAKDAFNDMIDSMLKDMAKFIFSRQVQQFTQLLTDWVLAAMGTPPGAPTINSASVAAPRYMVQTPSLPSMDAGVRTLSAGAVAARSVSPMPMLGDSMSSGGNKLVGDTNINVYNQNGSQVTTQESTDPMGNKTIDLYIEDKVRSMITTGRLDRQMQANFGLRRKPI